MVTEIIECECGSHQLKLVFDKEENTYHLAMFSFGQGKPNLFERIKRAYKVLKTGSLFDDQITLTEYEATKAYDFFYKTITQF